MTVNAPAAYLAALREGDRRKAFAILDAERHRGASVDDVYLGMLQPALHEIGRLWQENELTVAQEHLATAITQAAMARLYETVFASGSDEGPTLIAACADTERHEIGLRMVCDLLEMDGWRTVYLGATVPVDGLVDMVARVRPTAVALSASLPPHVPRVRHMIEAMRKRLGADAPIVVVGGRPFTSDPALAPMVGADATASDAAEAVRVLRARAGLR